MSHALAIQPAETVGLFPAPDEARQWDDALSTLLADAASRVRAGRATPTAEPAALAAELRRFDFAGAQDFGAVLGWVVETLETGLVQLNHSRYLGLFNPAPSFPAQAADRIAAAFNPQLASAATSPAAVAIEAHTIRAVAARIGLNCTTAAAPGHFTSGGSEANATALACALTRGTPGFAAEGARAYPGPPVFYVSADAHLAWIKIAHQAGIGRAAARQVPTDGTGRMDCAELAALIRADRAAGAVPVMLAATAGTTNAGAVDDLAATAAIARGAGLWFHVDAAWAGAAVAAPELKPLLAGIERADSVTIDAHKWFATTMGCGMFLTPHAGALTAAFSVAADFMPSRSESADPYMNSAQWSRRFLGLRLFLSLAAGGWPAHAEHVRHCIRLTRRLGTLMAARGWTIANDPVLGVLCLIPPNGIPPAAIVRRVLASGEAWVSAASYEGRAVLRACVTNGRTTEADIGRTAAALTEACAA